MRACAWRPGALNGPQMEFERKSGYLAQGLGEDLSARVLDSGWSQERRRMMMMMMLVLSHGAHFCALPVHIERKRPCLLSATLITDSFQSRHQRGRNGVLVYSKWITRLVSGSRRRARVKKRGQSCGWSAALRSRLEGAGRRSCLSSDDRGQGALLTDTLQSPALAELHFTLTHNNSHFIIRFQGNPTYTVTYCILIHGFIASVFQCLCTNTLCGQVIIMTKYVSCFKTRPLN